MADIELDQVLREQMTHAEKRVVATGGKGTYDEPFTSLAVSGEASPDTQELTLPEVTITPSDSRKEFTVESPEVQTIRQQYQEHLAKIKTGEAALAEVGKAGRSVAEAIAPGIEVAGRAIGLDEEGAAALSRGMVEFLAGLPGQEESDLHAGFETALAALPMVGSMLKAGKVVGKAAGADKFTQWFEQLAIKMKQEAIGQGILDNMEHTGKSPQLVVNEFWSETYKELPDAVKERFHKLIKQQTGFEPGSIIAVDKQGKEIRGKDWPELYSVDTGDVPDSVEHLEGSQRGLISLMEMANMRRAVPVEHIAIADEFQKAVDIIKSERGSVPVGGGGGGQPPVVPPKGGAAAAGDGPNIQQGFKRQRDPKIDALFEEARQQADGFAKNVETQRRGTLSDEAVIHLSKKSDLTLESLLGLPPGTSLPPEHFVKARSILKSSHKAMVRSAREARREDTLEAYQQMFQDLATTRSVLTKMLGLYAEPSRTTRLMHQALPKKGATPSPDRGFDIADPFINHLYEFFAKTEEAAKATAPTAEDMANKARQRLLTGSVLKDVTPPPQDMRDFAEAIAGLPSEEEMVGFMKAMDTPTGWDVWKENWYNGMLLSLAPIKNLVGTPAILMAEIAQRGVMAGLDAMGTGLVKMLADVDLQRSVYMGEVGEMLNFAANKEAFAGGARLAWHAFKTGKPEFDVSVLEHTVPDISNTALWLYTTGPMGQATSWLNTAAKRWLVKGIDLGTTTGARLLLAGDTFNKFVAHQAELRAVALRTAYQTVEREGLTGASAAQRTQEIRREVLLHPELYPEAHERATEFAQYVALQESLGKTAERVSGLADDLTLGPRGSAGGIGGFPVGRWLLPFTTIMANAGKMAGEYSGPLQLLSPAIHAELQAGGARTLAATTKIAFSTMMLDVFYDMAREGQITGNGPRDKNANRQWQEAEKKIPNAWYDPASKQYRSCAAFEPFCTVTSAVADLHDMMSAMPPDKAEAAQQAFQALVIAVVSNAGVKSWTQGLVGALNTAQTGDFETYQTWFDKSFASSSVPYSGVLRQVTGGIDPHMRRATDLIETFMRDIPGLSKELAYERNALGKPMYRKGGWWNAFYHGHESEDPDIWQALNAHNYVLGKPHNTLDGISLDGKQADAYVVAVTDGLDEDIRTYIDGHEDVSDGDFARQIDSIVADHRKAGKAEFLREFPDVQAKIDDYQDRIRDGELKKPSKFTPGKTLQAVP